MLRDGRVIHARREENGNLLARRIFHINRIQANAIFGDHPQRRFRVERCIDYLRGDVIVTVS